MGEIVRERGTYGGRLWSSVSNGAMTQGMQACPEAPKARVGFLLGPQEKPAPLAPGFYLSETRFGLLELLDNTLAILEATKFVGVCYSSHRTLR